MIKIRELNPHNIPLTQEMVVNFNALYDVMNAIRDAYAIPMVVTSGVRTKADQLRINPGAPHSAHLIAAAADIEDKDGKLWDWVIENLNFMIELDVYMESKVYTPTWVHFQIIRPKSGNRIFIP